MTTGPQLIAQHDLYFDGGDRANGSLYLCSVPGGGAAAAAAIERLRGAGLWSAQPAKQVAEEQKPVYAEQMQYLDRFDVMQDGVLVVAARFDHPRFPSDAQRWEAWRTLLAGPA